MYWCPLLCIRVNMCGGGAMPLLGAAGLGQCVTPCPASVQLILVTILTCVVIIVCVTIIIVFVARMMMIVVMRVI